MVDLRQSQICIRDSPQAGLIRTFDVVLALAGILASTPVMMILALIGLFDTGSPFFSQVRVGRNKKPFTLYKLRTMKPCTAEVATHLASRDDVTRYASGQVIYPSPKSQDMVCT
ncbi:sugar transferase [Pseudomonas sp. MF4836]|uniref:sugar transferase n=1 Tax=Pseudomonas sp. MF4836 TaxID=1960827 RepID=UPI00099636AC|nr:sugar transferase [Pseudomonas sp. MF4836]OOV92372.1 hypothetical protein MF4836_23455 [Pseudomonas sp. MF4836]